MKSKSLLMAVTIGLLAGKAMAYPIAIDINGGGGLWTDPFDPDNGTTLLPAGSFVQLWWSYDAAYSQTTPGSVTPETAALQTGNQSATHGDYVLWSGSTPDDGGWGSPQNFQLSDANIPGAGHSISEGHIYIYVYEDNSPSVGEFGIMSEIYGPNGTSPVVWANQTPGGLLPPADQISPSTSPANGYFGEGNPFRFQVVPEPGTMALMGIGALTIAARRRRKSA